MEEGMKFCECEFCKAEGATPEVIPVDVRVGHREFQGGAA